MRYLKGGRLFECMRLESVFYADFESVLGCFPHETLLPIMRNMLRKKSFHVQLLLIAIKQYKC